MSTRVCDLTVRPLEAGDLERLRRLFYRLTPLTVYRRFLSPIPNPSERGLQRLVDLDHRDREALAAVVDGELIAVARYVRLKEPDHAEIAVVVEDAWQRQGIGRLLLSRLARRARRRGITAFTGTLLGDNRAAVSLLRGLWPQAEFRVSQGQVETEIRL